MADSAVVVTAGTGTNIDTRTEGTNGNHRQVVVLGDPATNAGVAPVDATSGLKVDLGADNDVTITSSSLPTGAATSAKQDTIIGHVDGIETSLSSIDGKITAVNTGAVVVSSSALPTGAATAAKQPALGTAGTASADVITVQGIASMTALKVDGSAVTQPVSNAGITTIAGAVSGTEMQVDVLTMPTVTVNSHAVTNDGTFAVQVDGSALTSLQLADDVVATLGTTTYTEASTKGTTIGAVRRDADTTLVDTTNEIGPLQMDANGRLKVEAFSGETLPVSLTSTTVTGTVAVTQSGTWDEVGINDSGNSITIDYNGSAISTSNAVPIQPPASGYLNIAIDQTGNNNAVDVLTLPALAAGTNAIGKLAANSGVDIGDVDVTSISAGTNLIGDVGIKPRTTGGLTPYHLVSGASTNATNIKASAGQVFGWYIYNSNASARKVVFHNTAGTPTAGASVYFSLVIPPSAGANVFSDIGIPFSTGIAITTVTGLADSDNTGVAANDLIINIFYS